MRRREQHLMMSVFLVLADAGRSVRRSAALREDRDGPVSLQNYSNLTLLSDTFHVRLLPDLTNLNLTTRIEQKWAGR